MTPCPTGMQFELRAGEAVAVVTEVGGGLRMLRVGGRDLVAGFAADRPRPVYRGAVLAPWPNRIGDGRYRWDGQEHQLPLTEPERGNALHGLACWISWTPTERNGDCVTLATRVWPQPGYPFQLDLEVSYRLEETGLSWRLEATNTGTEVAPYACSVHPYLVGGPGRVDDWELTLPADTWLDVDADRLLPRQTRPVEGTPFDFRGGRSLRGADVDHAFTGIAPGADGVARAAVAGPGGTGVILEWDPAILPWVQVHTADRPEPELNRAALAVEPMTAPPNALQSGQDVIALAPGESSSAWWRIRPLTGRP